MKPATLALFALSICAFAQNNTTSFIATTLAAAAPKAHPQIVVASATGITVGMELFSGHEAMLINAINGKVLTVQAGIDGSRAEAHNSGDAVYVAIQSSFKQHDPESTCSPISTTNAAAYINVVGATVWTCGPGGAWVPLVPPAPSLPLPFASLTACSLAMQGAERTVTDSTTNTWGATITGSGTYAVQAYCDGVNWTVEAK